MLLHTFLFGNKIDIINTNKIDDLRLKFRGREIESKIVLAAVGDGGFQKVRQSP